MCILECFWDEWPTTDSYTCRYEKHSAMVGECSIVMRMSVGLCISVCLSTSISQEQCVQTVSHFLCVLPVDMALVALQRNTLCPSNFVDGVVVV